MKRVFALCLILLAFSICAVPAMAQEKDAPTMAVTVGTGHIWTGSGSYDSTLLSAEWQIRAGFQWNLSERYGLEFNFTRDGAEIVDWLEEHQFTSEAADSETYRYTVTDLGGFFVLNPEDKASIIFSGGGSMYKEGDLEKAGFYAGVGLHYDITDRSFVAVTLRYRHVQDFIVPNANVVETGVAVGLRF